MPKKKNTRQAIEQRPERIEPSCRSWSPVAMALIAILGIILYANTLEAPFVFDDEPYIVNNPVLKDLHYFTDPSRIDHAIANNLLDVNFATRTVAFFSFALNYALHRLDVAGYHLFNIGIHVMNGLLVYALVLLTLRTPFFISQGGQDGHSRGGRLAPLFAALLFVSHPVQTQAVTYLSQRFASLSTLFCLTSLVLYVRARLAMAGQGSVQEGVAGKIVRSWRFLVPYVLSLAAAVLAMKTKEIAFTFPVIVALYEFLFLAGDKRKRFLYLLPLLLTMSIIPLTVFGAKTEFVDIGRLSGSLMSEGQQNPALTYLYTQFRVIVTYLRLLVLPVNQNVDYDYPAYRSFFLPEVFLSFLVLMALFGAAVALYRLSRRDGEQNSAWLRLTAFGLFWFFISLAVESTIVPLKDVIFEHRLYLPSIGIFLGVVALAEVVQQRLGSMRAGWVVAFLAALVAVWSVAAYSRNAVWGDAVQLWQDNVRKSPAKARAHLNLSKAYRDQGRFGEAVGELEEALRIDPNYIDAYRILGYVYLQQADFGAALKVLQKAVAIDGKDALQHGNLGVVYDKMNRMDEAVKEYRLAIGLKNNLATVHSNLSVIYLRQGKMQEALAESSEAAKIDPENADYQVNLGNAYAMNGKFPEAIQAYRKAVSLNPGDSQAKQLLEQTLKREPK